MQSGPAQQGVQQFFVSSGCLVSAEVFPSLSFSDISQEEFFLDEQQPERISHADEDSSVLLLVAIISQLVMQSNGEVTWNESNAASMNAKTFMGQMYYIPYKNHVEIDAGPRLNY